MTDTKKLKYKIEESGYRMRFLAKVLGLSYQGFSLKVNGKNEFRASEIQTLCRYLQMTDKEMKDIFFAEPVEEYSTKEGT